MAVNDSCKTKQTKKKPNQPKRIVDEMIGKKLWGTLKYRLIGWESINKVMCCCSSTADCEARLLVSFTSGAATTSVAASEECGRASSPLPRLVTVALSVQCPFFKLKLACNICVASQWHSRFWKLSVLPSSLAWRFTCSMNCGSFCIRPESATPWAKQFH